MPQTSRDLIALGMVVGLLFRDHVLSEECGNNGVISGNPGETSLRRIQIRAAIPNIGDISGGVYQQGGSEGCAHETCVHDLLPTVWLRERNSPWSLLVALINGTIGLFHSVRQHRVPVMRGGTSTQQKRKNVLDDGLGRQASSLLTMGVPSHPIANEKQPEGLACLRQQTMKGQDTVFVLLPHESPL